MTNLLDNIFKPKTIAVVGASTKEGTIGYVILSNLQRFNFKGQIYPVNPKADMILGLKCYPGVTALPDNVDLAIIVVSRDLVKPSLEECGQKGIKGIVTITAGFKEIGGEGIAKEAELMEIIKRYGMRMVGPNCYGQLNTDPTYSLNGTFSKLNPLRGKIAFMSQSGALGEVVIDYTNRLNLGLSMFISIGNKADISDIDILRYWQDDPHTEVILFYLENFENPQKLLEVAREITPHKPILAVKAGRTESGAKAISSHTGVLAGGDVGTNAFFEKCGIIRATSIDEIFDMAMGLSNQPLPRGNRVAVITNAGGPGVMATDALETSGLTMARFEPETIAYLRANLLPMAAVTNPIDVIASGGPDAYGAAVEASLKDPNVDAVIVIFVPPILVDHKAVINTIIDRVKKYQNGKTVLSCLMGSPSGIAGTDDLITNGIPVYAFPEGAARGMAAMVQYRAIKERPQAKAPVFAVDKMGVRNTLNKLKGQKVILGQGALDILSAYGIKVPGAMRVVNGAEIEIALKKLNLPVVMKIDDTRVIHKTDTGGVALNLKTRDEVMAAFSEMKRKFTIEDIFAGVMLQEMVHGGVETIIGMSQDPSVGTLMMFGLGGINVELMKDVAFKVYPLVESDASEMVRAVKGHKLLIGFRGSVPVNIKALEETILRLSQLAGDFTEFESFDVNPFIVMPDGRISMAVDARFVLKS